MTNKTINFKKERDFGDLFNASFDFLRQEFKLLFTALLYYVVPFLILAAIATTVYSVKMQEFSQEMMQQTGKPDPFAMFKAFGSVGVYFLVNMLLTLLANTMMMSVVYNYVKLYNEHGSGGFSINEVWLRVVKTFGSILIASIITVIVFAVGLVFCILPGVYLAVGLSLVIAAMVFEDLNFSDAFKRSFQLIKNNWWFTFGVFIVATIIIYALSILLSIPSMIMGFKSLFFELKKAKVPMMNFSVGFYVVSSITNLLTQLFAVLFSVLTGFLYFSFVEAKEKRSLLNKIDEINADE